MSKTLRLAKHRIPNCMSACVTLVLCVMAVGREREKGPTCEILYCFIALCSLKRSDKMCTVSGRHIISSHQLCFEYYVANYLYIPAENKFDFLHSTYFIPNSSTRHDSNALKVISFRFFFQSHA